MAVTTVNMLYGCNFRGAASLVDYRPIGLLVIACSWNCVSHGV